MVFSKGQTRNQECPRLQRHQCEKPRLEDQGNVQFAEKNTERRSDNRCNGVVGNISSVEVGRRRCANMTTQFKLITSMDTASCHLDTKRMDMV